MVEISSDGRDSGNIPLIPVAFNRRMMWQPGLLEFTLPRLEKTERGW
jgi:hypothetical protein